MKKQFYESLKAED